MRENVIIQKIIDAESNFSILIDDYNKLLEQYKAQTSFAAKIKQAVLVKKVDAAIYNILNTTSALIQYATIKNILSIDLAQHYTQLFKQKFNTYKNMRDSVFGMRKSKILAKRKQRATGAKEKNDNLQSVPVPSAQESATATSPEAVF